MLVEETYLDVRTGWIEGCYVMKLNVAFYFV